MISKIEKEEFRREVYKGLREENKKYYELLLGRAGKLLKKGKPFVVVACDEPYYLDVYRLIRRHEKEKGDWTNYDEENYLKAREQIAGEILEGQL